MNFEQFQNQSRLYVIGALEAEELEEFEEARKKFGKKARRLHQQMLCVARSIRAEPASGEIFRRDQGTAHGHGKAKKQLVITRPVFSSAVQFAEDKFLQKTVEVYLEQAQIAARSDG